MRAGTEGRRCGYLAERLYDAVWFIAATADGASVSEPSQGLRWGDFRAGIAGRVAQIIQLRHG